MKTLRVLRCPIVELKRAKLAIATSDTLADTKFIGGSVYYSVVFNRIVYHLTRTGRAARFLTVHPREPILVIPSELKNGLIRYLW